MVAKEYNWRIVAADVARVAVFHQHTSYQGSQLLEILEDLCLSYRMGLGLGEER